VTAGDPRSGPGGSRERRHARRDHGRVVVRHPDGEVVEGAATGGAGGDHVAGAHESGVGRSRVDVGHTAVEIRHPAIGVGRDVGVGEVHATVGRRTGVGAGDAAVVRRIRRTASRGTEENSHEAAS